MGKKSAEGRYVTSREIEGHLKGKTYYSQKAYLENILEKKELLSESTRHYVYQMLDGFYKRNSGRLRWAYFKNVIKDLSGQAIGDNYEERQQIIHDIAILYHQRAEIAEEQGDLGKARKLYAKSIKGYHKDHYGVREPHFNEDFAQRGYDALDKKMKGKESKSGLEHKTLAVLTVAGILVGLFFLSSNLTGNIIGNLSENSSNWLGAILLIVGLVGGFFLLRSR